VRELCAGGRVGRVNTMDVVFCVDCGQELTGQYCGKCGRDYGATAAAQRASSPLATATVQHVGSSAIAGAQQDSSLTAGAQRAVSPATAGAQRAVSPTSRPTATAVYALPVMNAVCYTVLTVSDGKRARRSVRRSGAVTCLLPGASPWCWGRRLARPRDTPRSLCLLPVAGPTLT